MSAIHEKVSLGGVDPLALVEKYEAPLYVYNADIITERYERIVSAFDKVESLKINYACKALTNINILKHIKELGAGLDTVSIQEVKLGIHAGYEPQEILFTPNCVSLAEIEEARALGVKINIDNLEILEEYGTLYPGSEVCLRINPHVMAGGNAKISVGHIDSKFGVSVYQMPHVHRIVQNTGIHITGLHMHTGSDILDIDVFMSAADIFFEVARGFTDLEYIDFGSGFKVAYKPGDNATDIEALGKELSLKVNEFIVEYKKPLTLMFEPGKFLVSESGYFLARVNVVKQTTSTVFAGLDTGFNHLIRPMFYDAYHHIINVSNPQGKERFYTVVGYICETDTFAINRKMPEVKHGDVIAFCNAGAYCFSMASNYNSRLRPAEVMVRGGQDFLIRRREKIEDILSTQIEID